jgi:hypothetical protein
MDAPAAVYQPDYPPGTTATSSAETIALLEVLLCEQATDHNSTVAPFHLAIFGTSIRNPGPSGQQATATLLGHDLVTNAPNLLAEAARAGYRTFSTKSFNLARPGATDGQKATPYMLRVGGEPPLYEFKGTMNRQAVASSPTHSKWMYYSTGDDGLEALQLSMALHAAGPSQAAAGSFGPDSYWSTKKGPSAWEAINFPHEKGSGTLEIQPLLTF